MADFELSQHEHDLLLQACRTADALDALQAVVDADGVLDESPQGVRAHPALVEFRQQCAVFSRLLQALGLPSGLVEDTPPQQSARYGIRGAVPS
jgi:hypothetical protein